MASVNKIKSQVIGIVNYINGHSFFSGKKSQAASIYKSDRILWSQIFKRKIQH